MAEGKPIFAALMNVQAELKAPKNQRNSFGKYNYRSCEDIVEGMTATQAEPTFYVKVGD